MTTTSRPTRRSMHRSMRAVTAVVTAVALGALVWLVGPTAVGAAAATGSAASASRVGTKADDGAFVAAEERIDAQTLDLTIVSPALLGQTAKVRLLLPGSWSSAPSKRYPQLWLLHGANPEVPDYQSWTAFTTVEQFMKGREVLTVMPSSGSAGFYTKEWNFGLPGGLDYETFHTVELVQILERGYRANRTRVAAGISLGSFGALSYQGRHPGFFTAIASYSGLVNTLYPTAPQFVQIIRVRGNVGYYKLWGSPLLNRNIWSAVNPYDLLDRMPRTLPLYLSAGDGQRGPFDTGSVTVDPIEPSAQAGNKDFAAKLRRLGFTNVTTNFYSGGTHTWPYWQREFVRSWPMLAKGMGVPA